MKLAPLLLVTVLAGVSAVDTPRQSVEVLQTRENLDSWLENMYVHHGYAMEEMMQVCGLPREKIAAKIKEAGWRRGAGAPKNADGTIKVLPYPGGRHPRIGFLEGAVDPQRGTKASIFLPWEGAGYVVLDLPEAIFSNLGLIFLAHTHVPTIWEGTGEVIKNVDWTVDAKGVLRMARTLPNGIRFGASIAPKQDHAALEIWLENGSAQALSKMRTQVCLMLKGAPAFNEQTNLRVTRNKSVAAVQAKGEDRWVLIALAPSQRTWNNSRCPCIHSDPFFPDAAPGQRVSVRGRLWFYSGDDVEQELARGTVSRGRRFPVPAFSTPDATD